MENNEVKFPAKILLLGKTGVGKSAFINYFVGSEVAESGAGKPVTQEITKYSVNDGRYPIEIYDTKGLEVIEGRNQMDYLMNEIRKQNSSDDPQEWFHTIFYCSSMASRIEPNEIAFIQKLYDTINQHIHVILTNCDACSNEVLNERIEIMHNNFGDRIKIFPVVNIYKKKRDGTEIFPCGKEAVSESVFELLWTDTAAKIAKTYAKNFKYDLTYVVSMLFCDVKKIVGEYFSVKGFISILKEEELEMDDALEVAEEKIDNLIDKYDEKYREILAPISRLYNGYKNTVTQSYDDPVYDIEFGDIGRKFVGEIVIPYFDDNEGMLKRVAPNLSKLCDNNFEDNPLRMIYKGTKDVVKFKKRFCNEMDSIEAEVIRNIQNDTSVEESVYERIIEVMS